MNKQFFRSILREDKVVKTICVYPGRFQPFGLHHCLVWKELCGVFGTDNVFICTSDSSIDENNPLSYEEKKLSMEKYGVRNIVQVSSPYRPVELTRNYDPNKTALVVALGEKDKNRKLIKDDGYYQLYDASNTMNGLRTNGYVYIAQHVPIGYKNQEINGTLLRRILPICSKEEFNQLMGWYDTGIHDLYKKRFSGKRTDMTEIADVIKTNQTDKHLKHPWEYEDLSYNDIIQLITDSLSGRLENATEKIDGQNLLVTIKNGEMLFARNKTEIQNPLRISDFMMKFNSLPGSVQHAFQWAGTVLKQGFNSADSFKLNEFFLNGQKYLNLEIIDPGNSNVIFYGNNPFLIFHSFIEFDEFGNELNRNIKLAEKLHGILNANHFLPPRKLVLTPTYNQAKKMEEFKNELDAIWKKYDLGPLDIIGDYYEKCAKIEPKKLRKDLVIQKYRYPLEILFSKVAFTILSEINHTVCKSPYSAISDIRKKIAKISTDVHNEHDPKKIKILQTELGKLNAIGGLDTILAIEGIVFTFNGKLMKYTGAFRFINQILGINRYSR